MHINITPRLQSIKVLRDIRLFHLQTLSRTDIKHNLFRLGARLQRIRGDLLPVVEGKGGEGGTDYV
jgi:hypothetical protein